MLVGKSNQLQKIIRSESLIALCLALSSSSEGHGAGDGASALMRAMVRAFLI